MAESIFIGWFGTVRFESTGSSVIFSGNLQADRFLGADGTAAAPTHGFSGTGDGDNGMYLSAADTLGWSAGGTLRLSLSTTLLTSTLPILLPQSATVPGITGATDTTTGFGVSGGIARVIHGGGTVYAFNNANLQVLSDGAMVSLGASSDVILSRPAANRLRLASGDVLNLAPTAFASLPTGAEGDMACVTDSNTATWGATIAGGGANNVLAFFNGTNWTVAGV